jgi:LPS-assembly protein
MRRWTSLLGLLFAVALATAERSAAQDGAEPTLPTLVADRLSVGEANRLIADGNVEVLYGEARLTASRVIYDSEGERLLVEGPITLTTGTDTIMLADAGELSPDLTEGLLHSARLVLNQRLQIAADDLQRVGGRYTRLGSTVASVCKVCSDSEVPLWQVRAHRIIHDSEAKKIYFDHARMEILGMPVFYLPRLTIPDPSVERATGFLTPRIKFNSELGTGLKTPYFIVLGESRDLTLTPYVASGTRTVEMRYRQRFVKGDIQVKGAVSDDDILPGETRYFVFADGDYSLPRDFKLEFNLWGVSDPDYLLDYDYYDDNRLKSFVTLGRTRRDEFIAGSIVHYEILRDSEINRRGPTWMGDGLYKRRFVPPGLGGIASATAALHGDQRNSNDPYDGPDANDFGDGMDLRRLSAWFDWQRDWVLDNGMVLGAQGMLDIDQYEITDDVLYGGNPMRTTPGLAVAWSWPLVKAGAGGARQVLEPVAQFVWSDIYEDGDIPNQDSVMVEFDEANLFSFSRFPGVDKREIGLRANLGLGWTRYDPAGWSFGLDVGRIFRADDTDQFSQGSGLNGTASDWLAAVQLDLGGGLSLANRALFDDSFDFTKNDLRFNWYTDRFGIGSSYLWIVADPAEERLEDSSEWKMDASYRFHDNWTGRANWRYDFVNDEPLRTGLGLEYSNECVSVDLSVSRRFTSTAESDPSTDFGVVVSLAGFGSRGNTTQARRCARF